MAFLMLQEREKNLKKETLFSWKKSNWSYCLRKENGRFPTTTMIIRLPCNIALVNQSKNFDKYGHIRTENTELLKYIAKKMLKEKKN